MKIVALRDDTLEQLLLLLADLWELHAAVLVLLAPHGD